jgi:tRNA/tmRNA/rRNA uracil-C5-methylase (TrmA/RlmC/RlmD family)
VYTGIPFFCLFCQVLAWLVCCFPHGSCLLLGFCEAVKLSTIQAHDHATAPACKHFGTCGGCTLQSLQYPAQLAHKAEAVAQQLMRVGKLPPDLVVAARQEPVPARADEQYGYRNKVQLAFSSRVWIPEENRVLEGAWGLGYYMPGSSSVVLPTTDCLLMVRVGVVLHQEFQEPGGKGL